MPSPYNRVKNFPPFTKAKGADVKFEFDALEADLAILPTAGEFASGARTFATAGGTGNAITVAHPYATWATYTGKDNYLITIQITTANTGAVTLNVDSVGAKGCRRNDGSALQSGDLEVGSVHQFFYDETNDYFRVPTAINGVLEDCEEQVALAASQTNFIGLWSAQTGAKTVPTSVYHNGAFWALTSNIADITAKTPGVDSEWVQTDLGISYAGLSGAVTAPIVAYYSGAFWVLHTTSSDITADVPGTSAKWSKIEGGNSLSSALGTGWTINCASGYTDFTKTVAGTDTFLLTNVPATGVFTFVLEIAYTSGTITFFTGHTVKWPASLGGAQPTFAGGKKYKLAMEIRGGTTIIDVVGFQEYA